MQTIIEKVLHLQNVPLFEEVPTEQLSHLAAISRLISIDAGTSIFNEGEDSSALYIIVDGTVNIMKQDSLVRQLSTYKAVGTFGFFDQQPRIFSARCQTDCRFLHLSSDHFFELMDERLDIARYLLKYFVGQLRSFVSEAGLPQQPQPGQA